MGGCLWACAPIEIAPLLSSGGNRLINILTASSICKSVCCPGTCHSIWHCKQLGLSSLGFQLH